MWCWSTAQGSDRAALNTCSREAEFWWLPFVIYKVGIIITYVTGVLQDLIN